jgi:hypothetical protein
MNQNMTKAEHDKLAAYLQKLFGNPALALKARPQAADSAEVMINGEFIGIIYKTLEDDELSYDLQISILDMDLDD